MLNGIFILEFQSPLLYCKPGWVCLVIYLCLIYSLQVTAQKMHCGDGEAAQGVCHCICINRLHATLHIYWYIKLSKHNYDLIVTYSILFFSLDMAAEYGNVCNLKCQYDLTLIIHWMCAMMSVFFIGCCMNPDAESWNRFNCEFNFQTALYLIFTGKHTIQTFNSEAQWHYSLAKDKIS